jgi:nitroreductase
MKQNRKAKEALRMAQTEDLLKFLRGLRAVRDYTDQPLTDQEINEILEVGRWTGSSSNKQPSEVVVVRERSVLQKMADGGVAPAGGAAVAFLPVTPGDAGVVARDAFDEGRLVERLLLAARALGLGANIGSLKGDGPNTIKQALGIPDDRRIWAVVTVGRIDEEARKARAAARARASSGRKSMQEFARWDRYA